MATETRAALDQAEIEDLRERTKAFMDEHVYPNEDALGAGDEDAAALMRDLQARVKDMGMWAPHLPAEAGGMGIGFMPCVYMNELLGAARTPRAPSGRRRPTPATPRSSGSSARGNSANAG